MPMPRIAPYLVLIAAPALTMVTACGEYENPYSGDLSQFDPDRPDPTEPGEVDPYDGNDPDVLEAQASFRTGLEFHNKVIWRSCTPNAGVCHNSKEYPDLRTPSSFAAAFGSNCNIQPGEPEAVYDGCERPGDRFTIVGGGFDFGEIEIGHVEFIQGEPLEYGEEAPGEADPGLHIYLADPIPGDRTDGYGNGQFARTFIVDGAVQDSVFYQFNTRWYVLPDRTHLMASVQQYQIDTVNNLLDTGVIEGDANRNGVFGAREQSEPTKLLDPGAPEHSYLIARMRGVIKDEDQNDNDVPGSRMPLANPPFTVPEMLAFFCLVEQFPEGGTEGELAGMIDYKNCSYTDPAKLADLNLLGDGVTWETRISKIIEQNCGCHSPQAPAAGLVLYGEEGVYDRLLLDSEQNPDFKLVVPGDPENSYLLMKIKGADGIIGQPMPQDPVTGESALPQTLIDEIDSWIQLGAIEAE